MNGAQGFFLQPAGADVTVTGKNAFFESGCRVGLGGRESCAKQQRRNGSEDELKI